jgi:hypothetical protein
MARSARTGPGAHGSPVGRLHPWLGQEGEQRAALAAKMVQQPPVGCVHGLTGQQQVDCRTQPLGLGRNLGGVQFASLAAIPCRQGSLEDRRTACGVLAWPRSASASSSRQRRSRWTLSGAPHNVHLLRNSFRYASRRDWAAIARDLKPVYTQCRCVRSLPACARLPDPHLSGSSVRRPHQSDACSMLLPEITMRAFTENQR